MIGHRISEVLPGYTDSDVFKLHRRVAQTGEPARVDEVVWQGQWPTGRQVDRAYDGTVVPLGPNIIITGRDVTSTGSRLGSSPPSRSLPQSSRPKNLAIRRPGPPAA